MINSQTYEKIVKLKMSGKHLAKTVSVIMAYVLFFAVWIVAALSSGEKFILIIAAGALSTTLLVLLTVKYLKIEYEYSFWYGNMGVAKIYAKSKRKALVETEMKNLLIIAPATRENISRAEGFDPESRVIAVSSETAENIWLVVTGGKDERRVLIFFEADERSLSMLKTANPHAFVKS